MRGLIMAAQQQARAASGFIYKGVFWPYEEVTNPTTGRTWMDRNLGASRVATALDDDLAHGDLFQWGRLDDLHQNRDSSTTETLSDSDIPGHGDFITTSADPNDWRDPQNDDLWQPPELINVPAPTGFRVPTEAEWDEERLTWATNDRAGAFGSVLKLTVGGQRGITGALGLVGDLGIYWTSSISRTSARRLAFGLDSLSFGDAARVFARSIRLIKEL